MPSLVDEIILAARFAWDSGIPDYGVRDAYFH